MFGPPGTGKTTALLRLVEGYLREGVPSERIGFVSFSRRALTEARSRLPAGEYPHFRTIHATAYRLLGLTRSDVLTPALWKRFVADSGFTFRHSADPLWEGGVGDVCHALYHLAAARQTDVAHEWNRVGRDVSLTQVRQFAQRYEAFKAEQYVWDYTDMIRHASGTLDVDVLLVDEAQDTSAAQWAFLRRVASHVPRVHFAGDDDQAVYEWSGADPDQLLRWKGRREVLPVSYRLPGAVKQLADRIAARISRRVTKDWVARDGDPGVVRWVSDPGQVSLREGTWLLLARHNHQLRDWRELARAQGVVYSTEDGAWSWHHPSIRAAIWYERLRRGQVLGPAEVKLLRTYAPDARPVDTPEARWADVFPHRPPEAQTWMTALTGLSPGELAYLRALRRSGESLTKPGRVRISTVHAAKGAEADHVALLTDVSRRVHDAFTAHPDAEYRVQYVAVTRARHSVTLIRPQTGVHWPLLG